MTRFSSELTRDQIRAINAQMVGRTLSQDPQPLVEGGFAVQVLESRGRSSGRTRQTPLGVIVRVAGAEAVTAISTYLAVLRVPFAPRAFPVRPGADPAEIEAKLDTMAVFRLDPREPR